MVKVSCSPVLWSLTALVSDCLAGMCSPARVLAMGPTVNEQHPLTLSLRTNSVCESRCLAHFSLH